ncbi:MAG: hypothetical protein AAF725_07080, partial [Acidobacteriota bacterium]
VGDELGEGLGLLRSRELQAARQLDGARQFFARAYDFGFTRSMEETLRRWPRDMLLEDTMRVVRRFKPQVMVSIFPPTVEAGHGQHQAAGWAAERIFELSRTERDEFPSLTAEGLPPWRIESLYRAAWFRPGTATMRLPISQLDPHTGRSIFQTALLSRSQHRCQDMGFEQPPGDAVNAVRWLAGDVDPAELGIDDDLFAGVDTSLEALVSTLEGDEALERELATELRALEALADDARSRLGPATLEAAAAPLAEILRRLEGLRTRLAAEPDRGGERQHVDEMLEEKVEVARRGLTAAASLMADAVTSAETLAAGRSFEARTLFWNAGPLEVRNLEVSLEAPDGWRVEKAPAVPEERGRRSPFRATVDDETRWTLTVDPDAEPSVPYFLRRPREGDVYSWVEAPSETRAEPFEPPPALARFSFEIAGSRVEITRELVHRRRDQALGEVRRPLRVAPPVEVRIPKGGDLIVWPTDRREPTTLVAQVISHLQEAAEVTLHLEMPAGWPGAPPQNVRLEAGGRAEVRFEILPPPKLEPMRGSIGLHASWRQQELDHGYLEIDYPHIRPVVLPRQAEARLTVVPLETPNVERIAYVRGASDRVPEMLLAVGLPVETVAAEDLLVRDLSVYDAVVLGSRAFEVEPALAAANPRLLDYARAGGLLLVQYQQYAFSRGAFAPFPLEIHRPHDRVTDETAAVRLLKPDHPVLSTPNALGDEDWEGWVQERGLYFAGTWDDDAWTPLLAMADPGGDEKLGGLLIADVGEGHYVYTGLAFFRQLPAGVPGAYRLFVNLLGLADDRPGSRGSRGQSR